MPSARVEVELILMLQCRQAVILHRAACPFCTAASICVVQYSAIMRLAMILVAIAVICTTCTVATGAHDTSALLAAPVTVTSATCPTSLVCNMSAPTRELLAPSWCASSNPLVVAQPHSSMGTASTFQCANSSAAGLAPPFALCGGVDAFAAVDQLLFVPGCGSDATLAPPACDDGTSVKFFALAATGQAAATLSIYDEHFSLRQSLAADFPSSRFTFVTVQPNPATAGRTSVLAAVADVPLTLRGASTAPCAALAFYEVKVSSSASLADPATFVRVGGLHLPGAVVLAATWFASTLSEAATARLSRIYGSLRISTGIALPIYAVLARDAVRGAHLRFSAYVAGADGDRDGVMVDLSVWWLRVDPIPTPTRLDVRTATAWSNCSLPGNASMLEATLTRFYGASHCTEATVLIIISTTFTVSTFAFDGGAANATLDIGTTSGAPPTQTLDVRQLAPAGASVLSAVSVWSEVVLRDAASLSPSGTGNATTYAAPPASVWLAVATHASIPGARDAPTREGRIFVVRLAQFSERPPNSLPPSMLNPAGVPIEGQSCSWGTYYSALSRACEAQPGQQIAAPRNMGALLMVTRWRALPPAGVALLLAAGCPVWNVSCIEAWVDAVLPPPATRTSALAALPQLHLPPSAAVTMAKAGPSTATAILTLWTRLAAMRAAGETPSALTALIVQQLLYGNAFALFSAMDAATLAVFSMPRLACDDGALGLAVALDTTVPLLGVPSALVVTDNAQHAFVVVYRLSLHLQSMRRLVDVCATLARDPNDAFMKQFAASCAASPAPRLPSVGDFLQGATACLPGALCPSFTNETVTSPPSGSYSEMRYEVTPCQEGAFCYNGVRTQCPTGFTCSGIGRTLPMPCAVDESMNTTCAAAALVQPMQCPDGTFCGVPMQPPLPAPPAYAQGWDMMGARLPVICASGEWCGLGRAVSEGAAILACPAGTFCSATNILEPAVCDLGGNCSATSCPLMPYCAAGSTQERLCPAGLWCPNNTAAIPCRPGTLCPAGATLWQLCPGGSYCPDPAIILECPVGFFCPPASVAPVACSWLSGCRCDGGCAAPPYSAFLNGFGIALNAVLVPLLFVAVAATLWRAFGGSAATCGAMRRRLLECCATVIGSRHVNYHQLGTPSQAVAFLDGDGSDTPLPPPSTGITRAVSIPLVSKAYQMTIRFEGLGLSLRHELPCKGGVGKRILSGVSGELRPGRICAIMGPSGAGKTTCLSALCGKASSYGVLSGSVFINGAPGSLTDASLRHLVGFCPQEDVMLRDLTVRENIVFSAETRLPATWTRERKLAFADSVIDLLDLCAVVDGIVGDEDVRGISGGQRKRVNIGIEMASDPLCLFLDEPTSGLDAAGSLSVVAALRAIADLGLTIALVLHQVSFMCNVVVESMC